MRGRWHVPAIGAVIGIAAAFFGINGFIVLIAASAGFLFCLVKKRRLFAVFCLAVFTGFYYFVFVDHINVTKLSPEKTRFIGTIVSAPKLDGDQFSFQMKLRDGEKVRVLYYLRAKSEVPVAASYRFGMSCVLEGRLERPEPARNFYGFDYRDYLYRQNIHWQLTPVSLTGDSCRGVNYSAYDKLQHWRRWSISWIETHFPENIRGISEALLFGFRNHVPEDVLASYRELGVIHLLAVSGLHVGLVVGALYYVMIRIGMTKERSLEWLFLLIPVYVVITGAAPSAVRAGCMVMVVLAALRFRRRLHPLDGISVTALLMLAVNPYLLFQAGFQLSFLVSFALIVSAPSIQKRYSSRPAQLVAVSVIAQATAFPILLYHFYGISLLSLPLNFFFIPFVSFFLLPFLYVSFFFSIAIPPLADILLWAISYTIRVAHGLLLGLHENFPGLLIFGKPSLWTVGLLYIVIFYGLLKWESGKRKTRLAKPAVALAAVCLFQWCLPYVSDTGKVTMLDVGQGDSILIELPHRKAVYLIDTGGTVAFDEKPWRKQKHSLKVGRDIVLRELRARGIRSIDRLILTHGDRDHIGGVQALLGHVHIEQILYGKGPVTKPFVRRILFHADRLGIRVKPVGAGVSWRSGNASFSILNPDGDRTATPTPNSRSVVIAARIGGLMWLFTGDLDQAGEFRLISEYPRLKIDVLKVAHHGSKTSTSEGFLRQIDPRAALISVGAHNLYGHPNPEVLKRLREHGVRVFRTDLDGAVRFEFDGDGRKFEWVLQREKGPG